MKIKCALVGLGRIGSSLEEDSLREKPCSHAGAIMANPSCELVAGADRDPQAIHRFRDQWELASDFPLFESAKQLLASVSPDILVIATYPESHSPITREAARSGVPVAICEKPLAHTLRDARRIARLHKSGAIKVAVNHERRYSKDYQEARRAILDERYGRLLTVRGTLYFGKTASHRAVLLHDGTHLIDIINFLTGKHSRLQRSFGSLRSRRSSAYLYGYAGSIPVLIDVGAERDHLVFEIELSFEHGRIRVGNGVLQFEKSEQSPYYEDYRSLLPEEAPAIGKTGYFANMLADAVDCVRHPEQQPLSSAADGLEVMKFIRGFRSLW